MQIGKVLHLLPANCAFNRWGLWLTLLDHGTADLRQQPTGCSVVIRERKNVYAPYLGRLGDMVSGQLVNGSNRIRKVVPDDGKLGLLYAALGAYLEDDRLGPLGRKPSVPNLSKDRHGPAFAGGRLERTCG
jgi:hypothetical protein